MPSRKPKRNANTRLSQPYKPNIGTYKTPKGGRRGPKYSAIYKPLAQYALRQQQHVKMERIADDTWININESSSKEQPIPYPVDQSKNMIASTSVEHIGDVEMSNISPPPSPHDISQYEPPQFVEENAVFHHHMVDVPEKSKVKSSKSVGPSEESTKNYDTWKKLLNTELVFTMLEYENCRAGKPALTETDVVWTGPCTTAGCVRKTAQVFCLLWCRKLHSIC
jgi:hypothetical protein